ncbi:RHS repeat-associated core domain-containing protein [Pseudomonas sp. IT-P12]|uniref:RHS repeat-associated core domain-containing protein n=1 Tax=Pseudomonas sp. IT-P12 TaxID=3026450 RepID=UPI0039DFADE3
MPRTFLLAADTGNSIIAELSGDERNPIAYSAYGHQCARSAMTSHLGFNGELSERQIGWYLLGNGYRAYSPVLMRFHSPDTLSPFGKGGLNAYMYCGGDPLNFSDPSGHMKRILNIFKGPKNGVSGAPSTSSLFPLIDNAQQLASSTPQITEKTIPALTRKTRGGTHVTTETHISTVVETPYSRRTVSDLHFTDYGPSRETPPLRPMKQMPPPPRFNDSGGQTLNEKGDVLWESKPFEFLPGPPPLPVVREHPHGHSLHYSLKIINADKSELKSVAKKGLSQVQGNIRN